MIKALNALNDLTSPEFRSVLIRSDLAAIQSTAPPTRPAGPVVPLATPVADCHWSGLFAVFFFLMAPVTALSLTAVPWMASRPS
jgi:hypothetical protein